jgi:hypothetical protein
MCAEYLKVFNVTDGVMASEVTPDSEEGLYASPNELAQLFGCAGISEADIRFAMALIHSYCNRASLWPTEILTPPIEIPQGRQETRLDITPVVSILEASGRYGMGRRDRQGWNSLYSSLNPLLVLASTGKPQWTPIDVATIELDAATGIVYLPWSSMLIPFQTVRLRYIGGYLSIPFRVKSALVELINTIHARGVSDRVRYTAGRITRQYANTGFVSETARMMLEPFRIVSKY